MPEATQSSSSDHFVLFADILGFSRLVKEYGQVLIPMHSRRHFSHPDRNMLDIGFAAATDLLVARFTAFHRIVDDVADLMLQFNKAHAMVFSDSFYMASGNIDVVAAFAQATMREFIAAGVPVRMGLGFGSFLLNRSSVDTSAMSGMRQSLEFLGTGVIHAFNAEGCGLKGLRIFLHPSVREHLNARIETRILPLDPSNEEAFAELNYLLTPGSTSLQDTDKTDNSLMQAVKKMEGIAPADKRIYYSETGAAIERMHWQLYPAEQR